MMIISSDVLLIVKYILAIMLLIGIILAPAWLARQTKKSKQDMILVRLASWLFGWTGIGWLIALFWSARK